MLNDKLKNKKIIIGISGGIAVYKICDLVSVLRKMGAVCYCIMTKNATEFVSKKTFEVLSNNPVSLDLFPNDINFDIRHVSITRDNDLFLVAPATANIISKFANAIADDFLTTAFLTNTAPIVIAPSMNTKMYNNKIFIENLEKLKRFGIKFVGPEVGHLACNDEGIGRLASNENIINAIINNIKS